LQKGRELTDSSLVREYSSRPLDRRLLVATTVSLISFAGLRNGFGVETIVTGVVIVALVRISHEDLLRRRIPNLIVLPAWALVLALNSAIQPDRWLEWLVSGFGAAAFFLIFALLSPSGLGMGDVKLAGFLGAALGQEVVTAILLASVGSALLAIAILAREGPKGRRTTFALGPFLAAGAIAVLLFL
jgi:leader peptidase (prepilin peptidase) / N-methyltransferase